MVRPRGGRNFFYLDDSYIRTRGRINISRLQSDIKRGVKRLNEQAYSEFWGSTANSLKFLKALSRFINLNSVRAKLTYSENHHFTLFVYTVDGFELVFKGVSGGYFGEGTRGCYDILKACGFNEKQCQRPFERQEFIVYKKK